MNVKFLDRLRFKVNSALCDVLGGYSTSTETTIDDARLVVQRTADGVEVTLYRGTDRARVKVTDTSMRYISLKQSDVVFYDLLKGIAYEQG